MYDRYRRETRVLRAYAVVASGLLGIFSLAAFRGGWPRAHFAEVTVERLNVVEPDGKVRLVISGKAPAPDAVIDGKTLKRQGGNSAGMVFYNDEGDENGGLALGGQTVDGRPAAGAALARSAPRFDIAYSPAASRGPITGRLILVVAKQAEVEPRLTVSPRGPAMFATDVSGLGAGDVVTIGARATGYPADLARLAPGNYYVQAFLTVYTQVHRSDGHTIWVHMNDGRPESVGDAAGTLYSEARHLRIEPGRSYRLTLTHQRQAAPPATDTEWLKHVTIQSRKLTAFWGRPIFIHATVLLPKGYDEHPEVSYPAVYPLGHGIPFSFDTDSADENVARQGQVDSITGLESGYDFYRTWISDRYPRVIAITLEQQTPYFPDSYSVNSANDGPYGDALVEEVIPALEARFRIIAKPYARLLEGASTSGWQTLALQLRNPDYFGGAWVLQPDPIDFRHYQLTNIYQDTTAFEEASGEFVTGERTFGRRTNGQVRWTTRQISRFEAVLGTHGRSEYQLEGWEAVYGPVGPDGYPKPLWDKLTGRIDRQVADYMREHGYDLRAYAERNWPSLGPKLVGKLHFFCGDMDDFFLNLAVYDFQKFLAGTTNPHYEAEFTFGRPLKGHSWHRYTWGELVRRMADHVTEHAPAGEPAAWRY